MDIIDNTNSFGETKVSRYNSAGDQLQRIDRLWDMAHKFAREGDYASWNRVLDRIWLELAGDLDKEDDSITTFTTYNVTVAKLGIDSKPLSGFNKVGDDYHTRRAKQYLLLMDKELFIRRLQNKLGKGTAWKDEFEDDF